MKYNKWTGIACGLVLLALIVSQLLWIQNSKKILEDQFENRASMALCMAVDDVSEDCKTYQTEKCEDACLVAADLARGMTSQFDAALGKAVAFHDLPADWHYTFHDDREQMATCADICCQVLPMEESEVGIALTFPERDQLIYAKMRMPIFSSIVMVFLVALGFFLALKKLRLARKTYDINQQFYNNIGHELRTPLTNIGLATKMLARSDDKEKYIDIIEHEAGRMEEHTEKMLHLAALEEGSYQLNKEEIPIADLLKEVRQEMAIRIQESGLNLITVTAPHVTVSADRYHLKNVISSLIDNCIKYGSDQPELQIETRSQGDQVELIFTDNGRGIAATDQKYVFDKYYRASSDTRGYGLGLSYVKMIVEAHKGVVQLISEVGKGSRFLLSFPTHSLSA